MPSSLADDDKHVGLVKSQGELASLKTTEAGHINELKKELGWKEILGAAFVLTNSWLGVIGAFVVSVASGGAVVLVWGLVLMLIFNLAIGTALGELSSAIPNAGGQYVWASVLAPKRLARPSAYFVGVCNVAGGWICGAGFANAIGTIIMAMVKLNYPDFQVEKWHVYVTGVAFTVLLAPVNLREFLIGKCLYIGMWISIGVAITTTVVLPARSPTHTNASFIFTSFENYTGWSDAVAFLLGLINANFCFCFLDTAVHFTEETTNPSRDVPRIILATVVLGFVTTFPLACVILYCLTDYETVATTPTGYPILELFNIALQSRAGATVLMTLILVCFALSLVSIHAYQARVAWAFSRDNGLPLSGVWNRLEKNSSLPLNAHLLGVLVNALLALLGLASTATYSSLIVGIIILPYITYLLPMLYSLYNFPKSRKGSFNLGVLGVFCRAFTVLWCLFTTIIYSFPFYLPATASAMNYISAIVGMVFVWAIIDWFVRAHRSFQT